MFEDRIKKLRAAMEADGIDVAVITDDDNVYYFSGYCDYLHMEFGRPTLLIVPRDGEIVMITPSLDAVMAEAVAQVDRVAAWNDGAGEEWRAELPKTLRGVIGLEPNRMPPLVRSYIETLVPQTNMRSIEPVLAHLRMVKTPEELQLARHAGQVGMAMMEAGRGAISDGVAEFEVALATSQAGARKAAEILSEHYPGSAMSPNTRFLQIMASGAEIVKTHHRASTRRMKWGEPVFLCFCGMTDFHRFKLGFDRTFWIGEVGDPAQIPLYEVAVESQAAALRGLGPGVRAEDVHAAYAEVILSAGFDYPFRCGRATGFSYLESPQLVTGDTTELQPGMVFAIDGSVSSETFRAQVGDSFIITADGYEQITHHAKAVEDMIV
ncbi:MAG: Xaa-Pro peptidase family protein [Pseudomonadota bacterium]